MQGIVLFFQWMEVSFNSGNVLWVALVGTLAWVGMMVWIGTVVRAGTVVQVETVV